MTMYDGHESRILDAIDKALGTSWWHNLSIEAQERIHDNLFNMLDGVSCINMMLHEMTSDEERVKFIREALDGVCSCCGSINGDLPCQCMNDE